MSKKHKNIRIRYTKPKTVGGLKGFSRTITGVNPRDLDQCKSEIFAGRYLQQGQSDIPIGGFVLKVVPSRTSFFGRAFQRAELWQAFETGLEQIAPDRVFDWRDDYFDFVDFVEEQLAEAGQTKPDEDPPASSEPGDFS